MYREWKRQLVHIALFGLAFTLKWLTRWEAVAMLIALLVLVTWFAPKSKLRFHFFRHKEKTFAHGATWYFLTLLALVIIFPPYVVAASWAILALGDGMATLVGRFAPRRTLPWNTKKSVGGSVAFVVFGALGCAVLLQWMLPDLNVVALTSISLRVALAAALAESLPLRVDDNVTVPLASAVVLSMTL